MIAGSLLHNAGRLMALKLLILGGTGEAAALARAAAARFGEGIALTTALAGRTARSGPLPGRVHVGGFGGSAGLAAFLETRGIDRLIDATHPFATRISAAARQACDAVHVPHLVLLRPPWRRHPRDRWVEVDDLDAAATAVARLGRRVLLTVGRSELDRFAAIAGVHFVVRLIEPPGTPLPLQSYQVVTGRGPFALDAERRLLREHAIDAVVCKASGGAATEAKIVAARELGLPVVIVRRPPPEPGACVGSVAAALDWLAQPPQPPGTGMVS
jgi:precorrin-6A/cobalt-precorrin-6A reductase